MEEEAENVNQEDEHENVTPDATNEQPNPSYDENFEKYPDSSENPSKTIHSSIRQIPGIIQVLTHPKPRINNRSNDKGKKKSAINTNFNAYDHSRSQGDQRGHQNPPGGQKSWFHAKKAYENWITNKIPYKNPKHTYDCIPAALADDLGLVRLALVFSVGLGEILNWRLDERILRWS